MEMAAWCGVRHAVEAWERERVWMIRQCTNNNIQQRAYRCMSAIVVYHVWRERNARRMQGKRSSVADVSRSANLCMRCVDKRIASSGEEYRKM